MLAMPKRIPSGCSNLFVPVEMIIHNVSPEACHLVDHESFPSSDASTGEVRPEGSRSCIGSSDGVGMIRPF